MPRSKKKCDLKILQNTYQSTDCNDLEMVTCYFPPPPRHPNKFCYWQKKLSSKTLKNWYHFLARLIVATLAICWLPNQVRRIMAAARPKQDWTLPYFRAYVTLLPIANTFFYLSSVVNPLLYNISSRQFRDVFLQVLHCHLTLEHVNKKNLLTANSSSAASSGRSRRPLISVSSWRKSSTKNTNKVSLSTFQSETKPDCSSQKLSLESLELNVKTMPQETSRDCSPTNQNSLCEHEL